MDKEKLHVFNLYGKLVPYPDASKFEKELRVPCFTKRKTQSISISLIELYFKCKYLRKNEATNIKKT